MANEKNGEKMNFFYLDNEEELKTKKAIVKKRIKNTKDKEPKQNENEKFSFEDEIIIGVSKKNEKEKKNKYKEKNNVSKKQNTRKKQKKEEKKKKIKNNVKKETQNNSNKVSRKKSKRVINTIKYLALLLLIITVIILAMFSPIFNIKKIEVEGNEKITDNEIISLSEVQVDGNIFKISKSKVSKLIKQNSYIDKVNISRKLPSNLVIHIKERVPLYLVEYANGYIYIDKQGYLLEISNQKLDVPVLQGLATETSKFVVGNRLDKEDLEKLEVVYKILEAAQANEINNLITRIDIENIQNLKLIFETQNKVAYLGDSSNLIEKIRMIKKILEQEESNSGEIYVNMDLNNQNPIFRQNV